MYYNESNIDNIYVKISGLGAFSGSVMRFLNTFTTRSAFQSSRNDVLLLLQLSMFVYKFQCQCDADYIGRIIQRSP